MAVMRQVVWGAALQIEVDKYPGGLKGAVNAIQARIGELVGSRNTFAKLFDSDDPSSLATKDRERAELLIQEIGQDPVDWGIGSPPPPPLRPRRSGDLDASLEEARQLLDRFERVTAPIREEMQHLQETAERLTNAIQSVVTDPTGPGLASQPTVTEPAIPAHGGGLSRPRGRTRDLVLVSRSSDWVTLLPERAPRTALRRAAA